MGKSFSKLTPRIANTFFTLALQQYFRTHCEYPWDPRDNITQCDITPDFIEDDNMQKGVPLIIVQNGPVSIEPAGFGNGLYHTNDREVILNGHRETKPGIQDSRLQFTVNSSTQVHVITQSKDDADELAFEISMFMLMLKYMVGNILQLQYVGSPQISPAQQMGQTGWIGRYMVSVHIPYAFTLVRRWMPLDEGVLLTAIETALTPVNNGESPKPGDLDENGNPINIGGVGGTNTGGQNGNWGGQGGVSSDYTADGIDDNWVNLRFKVTKDEIIAAQPGQPDL